MSTVVRLRPSPPPTDDQRRAADPGASVWVSASAGTGKTKVLTDRVLSLLLDGTPPDRILCLTFTRAAAAEMASRVAGALGAWTMADDAALARQIEDLRGQAPDAEGLAHARRLFARVLDTPGGLAIDTIHAFCQSLLRRFPVEAGVAPHFTLMAERDADELLIEAREGLLAAAQANPGSAPADALAVLTRHVHEARFGELIAAVTGARGRLAALLGRLGGIAAAGAAVRKTLGVGANETPEAVVERMIADSEIDQMGLKMAAEALQAGSKSEAANGRVIADWLAADADGRLRLLDDYLDFFLTKKHRDGEVAPRAQLINKGTSAAAPGAEEVLLEEADRLAAAVLHRRAVETAQATVALLAFADGLLDEYGAGKDHHALLDYDDLIHQARALLTDVGAQWVLYKLDGGLDHILIDEAQDTSPDQWRVVDALADEFFAGEGAREAERTVFAVGDHKQSIYSFQGADPDLFGVMRERLQGRVEGAEGAWDDVDLTLSFRSVPAVLAAVDAVFAQEDARDGVALDDTAITHTPKRETDAGLVELWPPVEVEAADEGPAWKPPVEGYSGRSAQGRLAGLVARRIQQMVEGREMLEAVGRPIRAGDIMVLVRRRGPFVEDLVRELKTRNIDVAGVDRLVLTEHIAVMDLMALGRFLLLPEDDLTLASLLKSPLVGLDEEDLFDLAYGREGTLWAALGKDKRFAAAHDSLSALLARADAVTPFELYADVLGPGGGRKHLLARLGHEADDPINEFLNLTLAYEHDHVPSLEGFLHWLEAGAVEVKRDLDHGSPDAVRVMTVHGAKGLEAPVVFLPDTLQAPVQGEMLLWDEDEDGEDRLLLWPPRRGLRETLADALNDTAKLERDREYRRLLYVAMTRAADRLYVCGWNTQRTAPAQCWYNLIKGGLDDLTEAVADHALAGEADFPDEPVQRLASAQQIEPERKADEPVDVFKDLPDWAKRPAPPEAAPPRPLAPSRDLDDAPPPRSPLEEDAGLRFRRGLLIHALLQTLPDLAHAERAEAAARFLAGAAHDLAEEVRAQMIEETLAVLDDPAFAPLFGAGSRAEVPIVGVVGEAVVSGQIDRLLVEPGRVTIVDFKTNRPPPAAPEDVSPLYLRQMAIYRRVLEGVYPGREIACLLLWTDGPSVMELPAALTDGYAP